MSDNLIWLLVSVISFTIYMSYIYIRYGEPKSISATYKLHKFKMTLWLVLVILSLPIMILGNTLLFVLAGFGIWMVAASPVYWRKKKDKTDTEGKIHLVGAYGGTILIFTSIAIDFKLWYLSLGYIIFVVLIESNILKIKNKVLWLELIAIFVTWIVLYFEKCRISVSYSRTIVNEISNIQFSLSL